MASRLNADPIVEVTLACVVLSGPSVMSGVEVRIPLMTGSITTTRIVTMMNAMIAAMMICANARLTNALRPSSVLSSTEVSATLFLRLVSHDKKPMQLSPRSERGYDGIGIYSGSTEIVEYGECYQ